MPKRAFRRRTTRTRRIGTAVGGARRPRRFGNRRSNYLLASGSVEISARPSSVRRIETAEPGKRVEEEGHEKPDRNDRRQHEPARVRLAHEEDTARDQHEQ